MVGRLGIERLNVEITRSRCHKPSKTTRRQQTRQRAPLEELE